MAHLSSSRGAAFSAVIVPHALELDNDPEWTRVWRGILTEADVEWFDFRQHLVERGLTEGVFMEWDGLHLTERGCDLLAHYIYENAPASVRE
jgi:hypothetical protein